MKTETSLEAVTLVELVLRHLDVDCIKPRPPGGSSAYSQVFHTDKAKIRLFFDKRSQRGQVTIHRNGQHRV